MPARPLLTSAALRTKNFGPGTSAPWSRHRGRLKSCGPGPCWRRGRDWGALPDMVETLAPDRFMRRGKAQIRSPLTGFWSRDRSAGNRTARRFGRTPRRPRRRPRSSSRRRKRGAQAGLRLGGLAVAVSGAGFGEPGARAGRCRRRSPPVKRGRGLHGGGRVPGAGRPPRKSGAYSARAERGGIGVRASAAVRCCWPGPGASWR